MAQLSQERARRVSTWLLVVAAIAFAALRAPFLSLPLERDEGEYAYVAWRMLEGEVPYRDAFDQKPPGVFLAYLGAFSLLGRSTEAIHLFAHLNQAPCLFSGHHLAVIAVGPALWAERGQ